MAEDIRDYGIAVTDALRLNECWAELTTDLIAHPSIPGDEALWISNITIISNPTPETDEAIHWTRSKDIAQVMIRQAALEHRLPFWIRVADGEVTVDPHAITEVSRTTLRTGTYRTSEVHKAFLEFRPLWVKKADWRRLRGELLAARYGDVGNARRRRGPPVRYDWQAFEDEAIRRLDHHGGFMDGDWIQRDLEREMLDWCQAAWKREPSASTNRAYITVANERYIAQRQAGNSEI